MYHKSLCYLYYLLTYESWPNIIQTKYEPEEHSQFHTFIIQTQWLNSAGTGWNAVPPPLVGVPPPHFGVPPPN